MTNHPHRARDENPPGPGPVAYACLMCISERKLAEAAGTAPAELPEVQFAVTLAPFVMPPIACAVPMCYGHISVSKQSSLMAANGNGLPPGLRPHG